MLARWSRRNRLVRASNNMDDLNDIYFFASVVQYGGFSAAARLIGVEKTRLSRRISALEKRLGVRLLQRTTRALALTEAGQRFYDRCLATVEGAQAAYDSVAELRREPAGLVRLSFFSPKGVSLMHCRVI